MATIEARTDVLRRLADGELTVEEADDRLAGLAATAAGPPTERSDGRRGRRRSVDEVIALAASGVEASFLRALRDAGFGDLTTDEIVLLADHGLEADWLAAVPRSVLADLDVGDLVAMADHGIEPDDLQSFLDLRTDGDDASS